MTLELLEEPVPMAASAVRAFMQVAGGLALVPSRGGNVVEDAGRRAGGIHARVAAHGGYGHSSGVMGCDDPHGTSVILAGGETKMVSTV